MDVSLELNKPSSLSPTMRSRATYSFRLGRSLESDKPSSSIPTYAFKDYLFNQARSPWGIQRHRIEHVDTYAMDRYFGTTRHVYCLVCPYHGHKPRSITVISARAVDFDRARNSGFGWPPGIESAHEWMLWSHLDGLAKQENVRGINTCRCWRRKTW